MNRYMDETRSVAELINTRIQIVIPSILAEGETFSAGISVTGSDALPLAGTGHTLNLENSMGIEGLPSTFRLDPGESTGAITGLEATGPETALIRARVEGTGIRGRTADITSNPAWVFKDPPYRLFWGDIHVHTSYSNCHAWRCLDPEWCYMYARDVSLLDFAAPADHLRGIVSDRKRWPRLQELARSCNEPNRFVTFLAFESSHAQGWGGDNNVYYLDDDAPYFWVEREDMHGTAPRVHLRDLWKQLDGNKKAYFTIPHHTGRARKYRSWDEDYYDPEREPLFEIYSSWGSSEKRHSRLPVSGGNNEAPSYFVDALKAGTRFGVMASSDDHATLPGGVHHHRIEPFRNPTLNGFSHKGLSAVRTGELTRESLFRAMRQRNVYASTHSRSIVDMKVNDIPMGREAPADKALNSGRTVRVLFTPDVAPGGKIILMRNGEEFASMTAGGPEAMAAVNEVLFRDDEPLEKAALRDSKFHPEPFVVYYARIESSDGSHQWTSPVWIDVGK
ncbi:MAG: hypothetical protein R6V03_08160 [Kiritimatiellia bacterium]